MENIHQKYPDLFSPSLKVRYEATMDFSAKGLEHQIDVPKGCWGSANGWTMLLGPSPGTRKDGEAGFTDHNMQRPMERDSFGIGPHKGFVEFSDDSNTGRATHWNRLTTAAAKGNSLFAYSLNSVANLDFRNVGLERHIPENHLTEGCQVVLGVMQLSRPRLLVPLTNRVYSVFRNHLLQTGLLKSEESHPLSTRPLVWFRITGCDWDSVMIRTPKHPSRIPSNAALCGFTQLVNETLIEP